MIRKSIAPIPPDMECYVYTKPLEPLYAHNQGVGWDPNNFLEFKKEIMESKPVRFSVEFSEDELRRGIPYSTFISRLSQLHQKYELFFIENGLVRDYSSNEEEVKFDQDYKRNFVRFFFEEKAWPAVEGVTVPKTNKNSYETRW